MSCITNYHAFSWAVAPGTTLSEISWWLCKYCFGVTLAITSAVSLLFSVASAKAWVDPNYGSAYVIEVLTLKSKATTFEKWLHSNCWLIVIITLSLFIKFPRFLHVFVNAMALFLAIFLTMYLMVNEAWVLVFRSIAVLMYFKFEMKTKEWEQG